MRVVENPTDQIRKMGVDGGRNQDAADEENRDGDGSEKRRNF